MPITMTTASLRNKAIHTIVVANVPDDGTPISLRAIGANSHDGTFLRGELCESDLHAQCPALVSTPRLLNEFVGKRVMKTVTASATGGIRIHLVIAIGAIEFRIVIFLSCEHTADERNLQEEKREPRTHKVRRRHVVKAEDLRETPQDAARWTPLTPLGVDWLQAVFPRFDLPPQTEMSPLELPPIRTKIQETTPEEVQKEVPEAVPEAAPVAAPVAAPEATPEAAPEAASKVTPEVSPALRPDDLY